ncbi:MAG: sulfatase-like hydrolase/transferase [Microthrixaceae bacterium]|nr:sulfatase-like hydrolase/transferase [Microthrixaceae bacterium]
MATGSDASPQRAVTHPNLLFVLSDQQRPDSCGVFGQRLDVTPRLDELATIGVAFDQAFTIQPVCGPARSAIQTGLYPTRTGCWRNGIALPPGVDTLSDRMHALGYQCGYVGKWHLASNRGRNLPTDRAAARFERRPIPPDRRGGYHDVWKAADALEHTSGANAGHVFDESGDRVDLRGYRVDALTDLAIDAIKHFDPSRPFLLFVSYLEPHHQNNRFRSIGPPGWARRFHDFDRPGDLSPWRGDWRWNYAQYLACCASIDANLGRLLDTLEAAGHLDDTIVVFTSDHGSHFRTRNLEYKRSPHDASIRVPLVIAGPGFRGGTRRNDLVTHLDLVPTLVVAGGGEDPGLDGRPLQNVGDGDPAAGGPEDALIQISESQIGRALRTRTHTFAAASRTRNPLAGHLRAAAERYVATHLYDNVADPHQRHNLIREPEHAGLRDTLAQRLTERILEVEEVRPAIEV